MDWGRLVEVRSGVFGLMGCNPVHEPVGERYGGRTQIGIEGPHSVYAHSDLVVDRINTLAPFTHKHIS